jgi:hypothetical protein
MRRTTAFTLALTVLLALLAFVPSVCSAADKPTKMTVTVDIPDPNLFWSYPYIASDGRMKKPTAVQVVWNTAHGTNSNRADVVPAGKGRGQYSITTDWNELIDMEIQVVDAGKVVLGKASMQVRNTGREVGFVVSAPEQTAPVVNAI